MGDTLSPQKHPATTGAFANGGDGVEGTLRGRRQLPPAWRSLVIECNRLAITTASTTTWRP